MIPGFSGFIRTFCFSEAKEPGKSHEAKMPGKEDTMKRTFTDSFRNAFKNRSRKSRSASAALLAAALLVSGCAANGSSASAPESSEVKTVGLVQLIDQTSLNTIREAIMDEFEQKGYTDGENIVIDYQNAAGKPADLQTIIDKYDGENADVIIAIATGAAQSAQNVSDHIPLVFSAVADPVAAGLVEDLDHPKENITGTSFEVQTDQILDLIAEMNPEAKVIGALYTPGEVNGVSTLNRFKKQAEERGYTVVEKTGTDLTTLQQAEDVLLDECDVLFSPNDNIVASGMSALAANAAAKGIPYYCAADSMVMDGALATVGIDYEELGRRTADMAIEVLEGTDPQQIPIAVFRDDLNTYINQKTLDQLNMTLPEKVKNSEKLRTFE